MAVLSQQVNLTFAYSIKKELVEAFGRKRRYKGWTYYAFPEPARFAGQSLETLRGFRLSHAKASTLIRLGEAFASRALQQSEIAQLSDEEAIEALIQLKGIGRWSAETALMRGLADPMRFRAATWAWSNILPRACWAKKKRQPKPKCVPLPSAGAPIVGWPSPIAMRSSPGVGLSDNRRYCQA